MLTENKVLPLTGTTRLGRPYYHMVVVESTQDEAHRLAAAGAPHGTLVVAESQKAGKGRQSRTWVSPPASGIYATLLLRPDIALHQTPLLTLLAAVAAVEAIRVVTDLDTLIKWPNDILVGDRKVAGILTEAASGMGTLDYLLIGIGINVNTPRDALPARPIFPASSLAIETGHTQPRAPLLAAWLEHTETLLEQLRESGSPPLTSRWMQCSGIQNRQIAVTSPQEVIYGTAKGIDAEGALLLETPDRGILRVLSGDVSFTSQDPTKE